MAVWIHNVSGSGQTWVGQLISNNAYYQIQAQELVTWQNNSTLLSAIGAGDAVVAKDDSGSNDLTDVSTGLNYLKDISYATDSESTLIMRAKAAPQGWTFHMCGVEFETSVLGSVVHNDKDGLPLGETTIKFYDADDVELTTQGSCDTDCVKTVLDYEPAYDYEIIGGSIKAQSAISDNIRIWIVAVPDLSYSYGGSRVMVENINLKYFDPNLGVTADGRVAKRLVYNAAYHTNKLRLICRHSAGTKQKLLIVFELYRS